MDSGRSFVTHKINSVMNDNGSLAGEHWHLARASSTIIPARAPTCSERISIVISSQLLFMIFEGIRKDNRGQTTNKVFSQSKGTHVKFAAKYFPLF